MECALPNRHKYTLPTASLQTYPDPAPAQIDPLLHANIADSETPTRNRRSLNPNLSLKSFFQNPGSRKPCQNVYMYMYMYICIHIQVYVYIYIYIYICIHRNVHAYVMHACMHTHRQAYTSASTPTCTYTIHIHIHVHTYCMCVYIYICLYYNYIYIYMCVCVCYMYMYVYTHTHSFVCLCIRAFLCSYCFFCVQLHESTYLLIRLQSRGRFQLAPQHGPGHTVQHEGVQGLGRTYSLEFKAQGACTSHQGSSGCKSGTIRLPLRLEAVVSGF